MIRPQPSSSASDFNNISTSVRATSGGIPNSRMSANSKTTIVTKQHSTVTVDIGGSKIERVDTNITDVLTLSDDTVTEYAVEETTVAFEDRESSDLAASTSVNKKRNSDESSTSGDSTKQGSTPPVGKGPKSPADASGGALSRGSSTLTQQPQSVAFDPSTNEFTYLITVPRQLVDIHSVGSVVRTTGEAARLKHLMQYVADRYAPLQPPGVLSATAHQNHDRQIPLLHASNSASLQHAAGNVCVEIALTEAAIIDKSVYAQHERRATQTNNQQAGSQNSNPYGRT